MCVCVLLHDRACIRMCEGETGIEDREKKREERERAVPSII